MHRFVLMCMIFSHIIENNMKSAKNHNFLLRTEINVHETSVCVRSQVKQKSTRNHTHWFFRNNACVNDSELTKWRLRDFFICMLYFWNVTCLEKSQQEKVIMVIIEENEIMHTLYFVWFSNIKSWTAYLQLVLLETHYLDLIWKKMKMQMFRWILCDKTRSLHWTASVKSDLCSSTMNREKKNNWKHLKVSACNWRNFWTGTELVIPFDKFESRTNTPPNVQPFLHTHVFIQYKQIK